MAFLPTMPKAYTTALDLFKCPHCRHPFSEHSWGYEGDGICNDARGGYKSACAGTCFTPDEIEIAFLRLELKKARKVTR